MRPHEIERIVLDLVLELANELHPAQAVGQAGGPIRGTKNDSLQKDFGIDSLARAELAIRIERTFGTRIPDRVVAEAETPADLIRAITALPSGLSFPRPVSPFRPRPLRPSDYPDQAKTLLEVLTWHAERSPNKFYLEFIDLDEKPHRLTFGELLARSRILAQGLKEEGLSPGEPVAIMLGTSLEFFYAFFGTLIAGGIAVPLYPPDRPERIEDYVRRQSDILANCEARFLTTSHLLAPRLPGFSRLEHIVTPQSLFSIGMSSEQQLPLPELKADDTAFLQYTSGSTGDPKGVVLSHANLLANIRAMGAAVEANSSDVFVSWLPLYHDMGLIGACLGTLYYGASLALLSPVSFLVRPARWLWLIHRYRATLSAAPNFGYELCASRISDIDLRGLDLSSWRVAFNGAEPVSADTLLRFTDRFHEAGFDAKAWMPVYGLAESTVGLTFPPLRRGPRIETLKRSPFLNAGRAVRIEQANPNPNTKDITLVGCGTPLPGHRIRITDPRGRELGEREIGQIEFRGPSSTSGYFRNAEATHNLLRHAPWLNTGDLGYLADGELFIAGRAKDVIIRAGRHVFPQELEERVGELPGIRKGCVAVFGVTGAATGTERVIVAAEIRPGVEQQKSQLQSEISQLSARVLELPADEVLLLPPRSLPKTSSGKLRRSECRRLYETQRLGRPFSPWRQWTRLTWRNLSTRALSRAYGFYAWAIAFVLSPILALGIVALPSLPMRFAFSRRLIRFAFKLTGIPLNVTGEEELARMTGPRILVANHSSYIDVIALTAALPHVFHFVAKKEFEAHWLFGPIFRRAGCVFVERSKPEAAIEDTHSLEQVARNGESMLIFPEGTFTRETGLRPFRLGAFLTAARTATPVLPVLIQGTRSILPADRWLPQRGSIRILICPTIEPRGGPSEDEWSEALRLRDAARNALSRTLS